jgi:hypothetical protein
VRRALPPTRIGQCCAGDKYAVGLSCAQDMIGLQGVCYRSNRSYWHIGLCSYTGGKGSLIPRARRNIKIGHIAAR